MSGLMELKASFSLSGRTTSLTSGIPNRLTWTQSPESARALRSLMTRVFWRLEVVQAPMNVPSGASTGSEMMRLNMATPPTKIGEGNRLGAVGGDVLGYPNGRRLADDVVDISVQAVAGATLPLVDKSYAPDPLATQLGDGVDMNDRAFLPAFPYVASPWEGFKAFFTEPYPFVRCGSGKVFRLNPDASLGRYVSSPTEIGGAPVLQQSASVSADQIRAICGSN